MKRDRRLKKKLQAPHPFADRDPREQIWFEGRSHERYHLIADSSAFHCNFWDSGQIQEPVGNFNELSSLHAQRTISDRVENLCVGILTIVFQASPINIRSSARTCSSRFTQSEP